MLIEMTGRGPDSAGLAIYRDPAPSGSTKITAFHPDPVFDWDRVASVVGGQCNAQCEARANGSHAVIISDAAPTAVIEAIEGQEPDVQVMSYGDAIEIYKEMGLPEDVAAQFGVQGMAGSHIIGHTRMATESAVTTMGAHPFSTGSDQCLVHNGSLSNHNSLRRKLKRDGIAFETDNDSEVAAAYLTNKMNHGSNLGEALESSLDDLDGFFTFVVGTKDGFGVVRDPIACKPAVMAETDQYVAFGSEYRALVNLPGIEQARVWEPEPATVYFWEH